VFFGRNIDCYNQKYKIMENIQLIAIIIQVTALFSYLGYCLVKYGLTDTISATWYEHPNKWGKIAFTLFLQAISIPILAFLPEDSSWNGLVIAGVAGVVLVSVAANYKDDRVVKHHVFGAILGAIFVLAGIWVCFGALWPILTTALIAGLTWLLKLKGATYIAEAATMLTAIGFEIQNYLS
jgi:hypothetical protein